MTFNDYSTAADKTAIYPARGENLVYPVLGLCGESGEIAEKIKKLCRDHDGVLTLELREQLIKELGDVLWHLNAICYECDTDLATVAKVNVEKLASRQARGKLHGNGDDR